LKGFLEEENCPITYRTFLDECKYLKECKYAHGKGLIFQKTIHGKSLKDFFKSEIHLSSKG